MIKGCWLVGVLIVGTGCGRTVLWDVPTDANDDGGSSNPVPASDGGHWTGIVTTNKLDVLVLLDNSSSMADKQSILATALPDLVRRLDGAQDLHVGVITSSLGGHGSSSCKDTEDSDDHAELLGSRPRGRAAGVDGDFIEWTPADGVDALSSKVQAIVGAAGESGCGFEAQLESVYRFLADPFPPQDVTLVRCGSHGAECAAPVGIDQTILKQRAAFLRPDSAVAIVLLSDENDCSIQDSLQYYVAADLNVLLPAAANVCGTDPNDPCCYSCGLSPPKDCAPDPICGPPVPSLDATMDTMNLRCFDQKRRFGLDFLYPVERYVNAFTKPTLCTTRIDLDARGSCPLRADRFPGLAANPLFEKRGKGRAPSMVHLLGIVGVPWQSLAVDPADAELHYRSPGDLASFHVWDDVLGDPGRSLPKDAHMVEAVDPRPGLVDPNAGYLADPVHGHERNIFDRNDLQYACIYEVPKPGPCIDFDCDCYARKDGENNPICQNASGEYERIQHFARAYPGLRELSVIEAMDLGGSVASICPRELSDSDAQDYGYGPAVEALANELAKNLK